MFGGIFGKFMLSQLYRKIEFKEQISNQTHKAVIVQHYMRGIKELHRWDKVLELKDGCGAVIWGGGLYPNVEMKRMQMGKVPCFIISTYY